MKANLKTAGIVAVSAALLYFPVKRLIKAMQSSHRNGKSAEDEDPAPARRKRKAHHRHLLANKAMNWH